MGAKKQPAKKAEAAPKKGAAKKKAASSEEDDASDDEPQPKKKAATKKPAAKKPPAKKPKYDSESPSIILNLLTFFSLGILKVPWDSLVSISRLWISMSLFLTWYSTSNFSPKTEQDWS